MKDTGGPYVTMAAFCERTLEEKDGVMSYIRVIDRITITAHGADAPDKMPTGQVQLIAVITLRGGKARGRHTISMQSEKPSGEMFPKKSETPVLFEGEDRGVNVVIQVGLQVDQEGVYWFHVYLDGDQFLTKMPLRIIYLPMRT